MVMDSLTRRIRRSGSNPSLRQDMRWPFWSFRSTTGATVTDESALGLVAFYRGVKMIGEAVGTMPLHVYQTDADGTRTENTEADTAYLRVRPNIEMSRATLWTHVVADMVRGNGFIWVDKNRLGLPAAIWYLDRRRVRVGRTSSGQKIYEVDSSEPMIDYRDGGEIVHFPNWGDGLMGYDIVRLAADAIALGLSAQEYAAKFFANDGVPPGYLSTDKSLTTEESDRISAAWQRRVQSRRIPVLSGGAKFATAQTEPEKAQMMTLRSFQTEEIATLLGIPPHMLGRTEKVTSWGAGIAEQGRGFVTFTLLSYIVGLEQAIDGSLLTRELTGRFCKFDPDGLMRGTLLQRYQAYTYGYGRWLTPNDIRRMEDMEPVEGGDVLPAPSNMIPVEQLGNNFAEQPR